LFVRCEKGISHNPAEAITLADVEIGTRVLLRFIEQFTPRASVWPIRIGQQRKNV